MRGKDIEDIRKRLTDLLTFYFDEKYTSLINNRIIILSGDLSDNMCGLEVAANVQTVIHAAASVKHYGAYKCFYDVNVESTNRVIKFAKLADANLIHTSTLSVSGNSMGDNFGVYRSEEEKFFGEKNLFIEQDLGNVYARGKFEAEKAVMAIAEHCSTEYNTFHINSDKVVYFDRLLEYIKEAGIDISVISGKKFSDILRDVAKQSDNGYLFETFINDMDENEHLNYDSNIWILNDFMLDYLKYVSCEWLDIDLEYVKKYVNYFRDIGYLEV